MIILILFFLLMLVALIYFLFAPIIILINSRKDIYSIQFHKLFRINFFKTEDPAIIELEIGSWKREIDLSERMRSKEIEKKPAAEEIIKIESEQKEDVEKKGFGMKNLEAVLNSFKINKLHLSVSTQSEPLNALLYVWFYGFRKHKDREIEINFWNDNAIEAEIENTLFRIIRANNQVLTK